jgi:hypothetical protein
MRHPSPSILLAAAWMALASSAAIAQSAPPIKPGLWEAKFVDDGSGGSMRPDMTDALKGMKPEQRKQMEAMMKERGIDMSGGPGTIRMCLTQESLDQGRWNKQEGNCKTDIKEKTARSWKWHSVCADPKAETTGEASFPNSESYAVKSTTTMVVQGQTKVVKTAIDSKWLGADCGDVKPIQPGMRSHKKP